MAFARAHVFVSGIVQGVFFRAHARDEANNLGIVGWVKNNHDGRVEAVFDGEKRAVEKMIEWCHDGPAHAMVDKVEVKWENPTNEFDSFTIKY